MIEVRNLTKKYGSHIAISDLSFTVEKGRIYGFLGPNGAGKSTTMNIITGCLAATSGSVAIDGHDILEDPVEAKKHIGYLPEFPPLYIDMTSYEYLDFVAQAKGVPENEIDNQIRKAMAVTGTKDVGDRLIKNLSKGYKQRIGIAQAMIGNPDVIILDEPTVGLDPIQIIEIRDLIKSLGKDHTVILSSHILSEISAVCDYVMIISHGKMVVQDTIDNLSNFLVGENVMELVVKGSAESIKSVLEDIPEAEKCVIDYSNEGPGIFSVRLEYKREVDIRERISSGLVRAGCVILNMNTVQISLEEVFLKLTGDEADEYLKKLALVRKETSLKAPAAETDAGGISSEKAPRASDADANKPEDAEDNKDSEDTENKDENPANAAAETADQKKNKKKKHKGGDDDDYKPMFS